MLAIEEVKKRLEDRNLSEVARRTGLSYSQVYGVFSGKTLHAPYDIVKILSDYLNGEYENGK